MRSGSARPVFSTVKVTLTPGISTALLRKAGSGERQSGTRVRVWPDPRYFESAELPRAELTHLLRSKAVLMPGIKVSLTVEASGRAAAERLDWIY